MEINVLIDESLEEYPEADWLKNIAGQAFTSQHISSEVEMSLVITTQKRVQELNQKYRGLDEPTDVLAFSLLPDNKTTELDFQSPPDGIKHLGEVIISYPQAEIQAKEHHHSIKREISILAIHGTLHLLGYDHDTPGAEHDMRAKETEILSHIEGEIY